MKKLNSLLKDLVKIKSFSGDEINICNYVFNLLKGEGFNTKKIFVDGKGFDIFMKVGTPKIIFATHLDTVGDFLPVKETKSSIFGRGACDAKASLATMVCAAVECKNQGLSGFGLIFTIREEEDFKGVKKILENKIKIPFVVVGEPTSLDMVNGHFGVLSIKLAAFGKKAHSSNPQKGINAIDKLLEAIKLVKQIKSGKSFFSFCEIKGGIASNIIPDYAEAIVTFRISPDDRKDYFKIIKEKTRGLVKSEKILEVGSVLNKIPKEFDFIRKTRTVKYATELSFYKNGVVLGPGDIKFAHSDNEFVKKAELKKAVKIYKKIVSNYNSR